MRRRCQCGFIGGHRLFAAAQFAQHMAARAEGLRRFRRETKGFVITRQRLFQKALLSQEITAQAMSLREPAIERQCLLHRRERLQGLPKITQCQSEFERDGGPRRIKLPRPGENFGRLAGLLLPAQEPAQFQHDGRPGRAMREEAQIDPPCLGQAVLRGKGHGQRECGLRIARLQL